MTTLSLILSRLRQAAQTLATLTDRFSQIDLRFDELKINHGILLTETDAYFESAVREQKRTWPARLYNGSK
jgi:hypothetical protein